ncbi:MAG TPA: phosphotriesterase-related protein [Streptosporangiaceae bacterium]|jgi:phosphotriesterase-related protein|nr:phosphotriesterase-related protein [Streptosporangiaceae bacterium]
MAQVETVRGPIDAARLGVTLMHEHVFVLNEEIRRNYPATWDEDQRTEDAVAKLNALHERGGATIADPTVIGLGRDIERIAKVAARTELNIIVAAGIYTYNDVPLYFQFRGAERADAASDPMTRMFIADITEGIAGTPIKAAFLKCAIEEPGLTPGVERVMRAVARAHAATGAPITVHTHPASRSGLTALRVLGEEDADLTRVVLGHSGDSTDVDHLAELADQGCLLGMDRFGLDILLPLEQRVATVAALCARGYADRMVLSHDASCHIDWFSPEQIARFAPSWHYGHLFDDVLPALRERGVSETQLEMMLVGNPRRYFSGPSPQGS